MCNFFSAVIGHKHRKIYYDIDLDSHTDIMDRFKIKDDKEEPNFVKIEFLPVDGDVFNHARENWKVTIDEIVGQKSIPAWYDEKRADDQAWEALQDVIAKRFLVGAKDCEIKEGRWYVRGSSRVEARDSSSVDSHAQSVTIRGKKIIVADKSFTIEYVEAKP
jgi:hypothetical protein